MKIGLVRHFKVMKGYPSASLTQERLFQWIQEYDSSDIEGKEVNFKGTTWDRCFSSDLYRAEKTARQIYKGDIDIMEELREIPIYPLFKRNVKMPFPLWMLLIRLSWMVNHKSQLEKKVDVINRIEYVVKKAMENEEENILIVSHGALMIYIQKYLVKNGFSGPKITRAKNGVLYLFEKS
ncbi:MULTISPECIES: histidine phosphatase family protein [Metabacillus]|uniref:Phosphoglycerate mutase n=2 Tax=Metabacillus TaxID=2675233 RepID=A0A179T342_9BACI|nr:MULTISPECIES: histidine phosphatase family protein [Metabacillus]OAS88395.1 phosphoglycerate mutase [Metabacillus litoralis]QNF28126.1 histidine phosphatase family protein [Metabacillus sp. KUDC1714]